MGSIEQTTETEQNQQNHQTEQTQETQQHHQPEPGRQTTHTNQSDGQDKEANHPQAGNVPGRRRRGPAVRRGRRAVNPTTPQNPARRGVECEPGEQHGSAR